MSHKRLSIKDINNRSSLNIDSEFFNMPIFGNSVTLTKSDSLYTFKGNFGNGFVSVMDKNFLARKKIDVLFKKINANEITIESFFMLELYTIVKAMIDDRKIYSKVNKKTLANLLVTITTETWFKPDDILEYRYALNMDAVNKNIALSFKDYQFAMFKRYEYLKNKLGYKGMLLDVATGGGKTMMSLALSFAVSADKVFIITLNQNLKTTWLDAFLKYDDPNYYFKTKVPETDIYTVDDYNKGKSYNNAKYIIFNYEALNKLYSLIDKIKYNNCSVIIDEAHNFVSLKSNRREELLKVIDKLKSNHILPLSGTAVKDSPLDMAIYIELLDPRANKNVMKIYRDLYGSPNKLLKEIVPTRYGDLAIKVEKHELGLDPIEYVTLDVNIPNPERYTLDNITLEAKKYFDTRLKEINDNEQNNRKRFNAIIDSVRKTSSLPSDVWDRYIKDHTEVRKLYDAKSIYLNPSLAKAVSDFEDRNIISKLSKNDKDEFRELTVLLKYPILKVRGEVLGRVVLQARINCHKEMAERIDYSILNTTVNKSILMSTYIPVCDTAKNALVKQGFKPIEIYGQFTKDQDNRIRLFKNDPLVDPLVGTYKSISTAHHFTVADLVILLDTPFRTYILDQAIARVWRTGQANQVKIVYTRLNINENNINSRNIDILKWAKSMVEEITGNDISYLNFENAKSVENIDLEDIDDILINDINQEEENEMANRKRISDMIDKGVVIDNDTGVVSGNVDNEGFLDIIKQKITKIKNITLLQLNALDKAQRSLGLPGAMIDLKKPITITSDLTYTTIKQYCDAPANDSKYPDTVHNAFGLLSNTVGAMVDNKLSSYKGLLDYMDSVLDTVEINIKEGKKKKTNRVLTDKQYDSFILDPKTSYADMKKIVDAYYEANLEVLDKHTKSKEYKDRQLEYLDMKKKIRMNQLDNNYVDPNIAYYFDDVVSRVKEIADRWKKLMFEILETLDKGIKVSSVDSETFEDRFYASLDNKIDAERYNIGVYPAYEIGDMAGTADVDAVLNLFGKDLNKLKLVRSKIDGAKKIKIIADLAPVYKAHRDYVESKKGILDDPNYKAYKEAKQRDNLDVGFERNLGKTRVFHTLALWYSDWGEDVRLNLLKLMIPILKKHLSFDLFLDETIGSDSYIYIVKKDGTVYDLVFDISHDGDSFSLRVVDFDIIDSIKFDMDKHIDTENIQEMSNIDAEGIVSMMTKTFTWLKDITTTDKQRLKGYAIKINPAAYNIYANIIDIGGEFLEKGIAYLDDEDSTIPVHIDEVDNATESIRKIMKISSKPVILEPNIIVYGEDPFHSDTYNDSNRDFSRLMATKFEIRQNAIISMCMILYKGKKLSEGFSWYIDMAELGIKTYKDDKEIVKSLTNFKNAIKEAMNYIDNNIKLVKIDNKKLDAETYNSIDHESVDINDEYIITTKTVDEEAIIIPIAIAAGAYVAYKAAEQALIENYGKKKIDVDYDSFDINNGSNKSELVLNHISSGFEMLDELTTKKESHLMTVTTDNINATDLEAFDSFRGLASSGIAKANKAFEVLKAMLKTNTQDYKGIDSKNRIDMNKEIGVPRGFKGNLLDISQDLMTYSSSINTLKSYIDTMTTELSSIVNSNSLRESSIFNTSFIKLLDKSSNELYLVNSKYLTNDREDRAKIYDLINNANDIPVIITNLKTASILINPKELMDIKASLSMIDDLVRTLVTNQDKFSKIKIKELGLLIDHMISYVSGVATLVYLKNSVDIILDDIKKVI